MPLTYIRESSVFLCSHRCIFSYNNTLDRLLNIKCRTPNHNISLYITKIFYTIVLVVFLSPNFAANCIAVLRISAKN